MWKLWGFSEAETLEGRGGGVSMALSKRLFICSIASRWTRFGDLLLIVIFLIFYTLTGHSKMPSQCTRTIGGKAQFSNNGENFIFLLILTNIVPNSYFLGDD